MSLKEKYPINHSCIYRECRNSSLRTPEKLWIKVPNEISIRNTWLKLADRDPDSWSIATQLYLCEDHFDIENDMENYRQYKIMGSVKRIRMKPNCLPSRFNRDSQQNRKRKLVQETSTTPFHTEFLDDGNNIIPSSTVTLKKFYDKAVQVVQYNTQFCSQAVQVQPSTHEEYCQAVPSCAQKMVQACLTKQYRSKAVQISATKKDVLLSPIKLICQQSIATSPIKKIMTGQSTRKLLLLTEDGKYDSDQSFTLSQASIDSSIPSSQTVEDCLQKETTNGQELHLQSTLAKIKHNPRLYIGIPKELFFILSIITKHTKISEIHILLCLMKVRLNRTFTQLADDFNVSASQAGKIFNSKLPCIVNVLLPFIKTFSKDTIKKNLPLAFRHKYNKVSCIIDCLEIEIQKPSKAIHQALTWSDYKKANTIKYLLSCTPDGLVSFISKGYGGRVSDMNLLEHSKFLDSLEPNSCVLADRGFKHVESFLRQKGFTLLRPPSVAAGVKLTKLETKQTKEIASLRIHVERVIRRLREFAILKPHSVVNINFLDRLDLCIKIACALINLQDSIINNIK